MKVETKLKCENGLYKIYVKKVFFFVGYWKLIYKTSVRNYALTTLNNLSIISRTDSGVNKHE